MKLYNTNLVLNSGAASIPYSIKLPLDIKGSVLLSYYTTSATKKYVQNAFFDGSKMV